MMPAVLEQTVEAKGDSSRGTSVEDGGRRDAAPVGSFREMELGAIIDAYNQVTEKLKVSHERLALEVGRLRRQVAQKDRELARAERLAALGGMAAGVAHEVRNPLGGILLSATMLEEDLKGMIGPRRLARQIAGAARALEGIVSDILAYGGELTPRPRATAVGGLVSDVVEMLRCRWEPVGCQTDVTISDGGIEAEIDGPQVQRAVLNIVSNAIDAVGAGGWVKVEVWREGDFVTIRVSDSGPGAPESVRSKVFDPFFTTKDSGTGLGLAIAHRVVDSHGGRIWVENGEVCGAVFTMELPIAQAVATSNEEAV